MDFYSNYGNQGGMPSLILTGASRGIGRALALALPEDYELHAVARDAGALASLGKNVRTYPADLAVEASRIGRELADSVPPGTILVHNAGLWPSHKQLVDGFERAFLVNCAGNLALQRPLLQSKRLSRILVIGAGLMIKGRFDEVKTPIGEDFHWLRTYASTKLAFAVAMRDIARDHPDVDVAVMHPGVVRTGLGARPGVLGWLLDRIKQRWESPQTCATRLIGMLQRKRWSTPGRAGWFVLDEEQPWPPVADAAAPAVRRALHWSQDWSAGDAVPAGIVQ